MLTRFSWFVSFHQITRAAKEVFNIILLLWPKFITMTKAIDTLKQPRLQILDIIKELSIEQLNNIPAGFNNNIAWNLGHMVATQQSLCYTRSDLDKVISDDFFMAYKPGSKPGKFIDEAELGNIKELLFSTLEQLEIDLQNNLFTNYTPLLTRYGVPVDNIDEAVSFLPFHEGLHIGYIMSIKKMV